MTQQHSINFDRELPKPTFYNTTGQNPEVVKEKKLKAKSLANEVLAIFSFNPQVELTAWDVYDKIQGKNPITSVRRAISDLVEMNYLQYVGKKVSGPWNQDNSIVKIHPNRLKAH